MERTTREFTTDGGHKAVVYDYITGNEAREIQKLSQKDNGSPDAMDAAQNHAIKIVLRELDGSAENIIERLGLLPLADYSEIVAAVTDLLNPKKKSQA